MTGNFAITIRIFRFTISIFLDAPPHSRSPDVQGGTVRVGDPKGAPRRWWGRRSRGGRPSGDGDGWSWVRWDGGAVRVASVTANDHDHTVVYRSMTRRSVCYSYYIFRHHHSNFLRLYYRR